MPATATITEEVRDAVAVGVRARRDELGLTREALAVLAGVGSERVIGTVERRERTKLSVRLLAEIAQGLLTSPRALVDAAVPHAPVALPPEAYVDGVRDRLRAARGDLGTPTLAQRSGVHQSTIVRLESGVYALDLFQLALLADALGVPLGDLL